MRLDSQILLKSPPLNLDQPLRSVFPSAGHSPHAYLTHFPFNVATSTQIFHSQAPKYSRGSPYVPSGYATLLFCSFGVRSNYGSNSSPAQRCLKNGLRAAEPLIVELGTSLSALPASSFIYFIVEFGYLLSCYACIVI